MPQFFSTNAKIHAAQDLINALKNPAPEIPILKLGHSQKETLKYLTEIFRKTTSAAVPPRVPVRGEYQEKLQQETKKEPK